MADDTDLGGLTHAGFADHPALREKVLRVRSDLFGRMWAPRTFTELAAVLEAATARDVVAWRGQSSHVWRLDCGAVRRLLSVKEWDIKLHPNSATLATGVNEYESALLDEARLAGHGHSAGRRLSDLEVLAVLQHHGAATRLLDFSRNALVATWFAAEGSPNDAGIVVGLERGEVTSIEHDEVLRFTVRDMLHGDHAWRNLLWQPPPIFPRMMAQQSCFVFANPTANAWGSLNLPTFADPSDDEANIRLAIVPSLKRALRGVWARAIGFSVKAMYPEVEGFSRHHSARSPLEFPMVARIKEAGV